MKRLNLFWGKIAGGLPWGEASVIFSQILEALHYAGENGVVHRDLKPSNIHVTRQGVPKLVNFGIARQEDGEATATSSAAGAKGTFDYMAPDFALMHEGSFRGDEQSDVFSFGVLLYYTLTGRLPFPPWAKTPFKNITLAGWGRCRRMRNIGIRFSEY